MGAITNMSFNGGFPRPRPDRKGKGLTTKGKVYPARSVIQVTDTIYEGSREGTDTKGAQQGAIAAYNNKTYIGLSSGHLRVVNPDGTTAFFGNVQSGNTTSINTLDVGRNGLVIAGGDQRVRKLNPDNPATVIWDLPKPANTVTNSVIGIIQDDETGDIYLLIKGVANYEIHKWDSLGVSQWKYDTGSTSTTRHWGFNKRTKELFLCSGDNTLRKVNANTGVQVWNVPFPSGVGSVSSSGNGAVNLKTGHYVFITSTMFVAISPVDGSVVFSLPYSAALWTFVGALQANGASLASDGYGGIIFGLFMNNATTDGNQLSYNIGRLDENLRVNWVKNLGHTGVVVTYFVAYNNADDSVVVAGSTYAGKYKRTVTLLE